MILDKIVEVNITNDEVFSWYKKLGYKPVRDYSERCFKNSGHTSSYRVGLKVKQADLHPSSIVRVEYKCDLCGNINSSNFGVLTKTKHYQRNRHTVCPCCCRSKRSRELLAKPVPTVEDLERLIAEKLNVKVNQ